MTAMVDRIMKRVRGKGRGWAFTPKDFIDFVLSPEGQELVKKEGLLPVR